MTKKIRIWASRMADDNARGGRDWRAFKMQSDINILLRFSTRASPRQVPCFPLVLPLLLRAIAFFPAAARRAASVEMRIELRHFPFCFCAECRRPKKKALSRFCNRRFPLHACLPAKRAVWKIAYGCARSLNRDIDQISAPSLAWFPMYLVAFCTRIVSSRSTDRIRQFRNIFFPSNNDRCITRYNKHDTTNINTMPYKYVHESIKL